MSKVTIISAGYRLTVTSWENDADNYNTVVRDGIGKSSIGYLVDLCKLMAHSDDYDNRLCNMYEPGDDEVERVKAAIAEVGAKHGKSDPTGDIGLDELSELGLSRGEWFTRVLKSYKVEFIAQPIELVDVTEEFK